MTEKRIRCSRDHWLFSVTQEGIAIKCRAGECRTVHTVPWQEIDQKREQVSQNTCIDINNALYLK